MGLARRGGWGWGEAWRSRAVCKLAAALLLLIYLTPLPVIRAAIKSRYLEGRRIERLESGAEEARRLHPDQIILLTDISDDMFWNAILGHPFLLAGPSDIYLSPSSEPT